MLKTILILLSAILLSSCGGSDGGGSSTPTTNSSSFPNVAGRYAFNTSTIKMSCSNGSTRTNPAIALNFDISQKVNAITLLNTKASSSIPGITIIDSTSL